MAEINKMQNIDGVWEYSVENAGSTVLPTKDKYVDKDIRLKIKKSTTEENLSSSWEDKTEDVSTITPDKYLTIKAGFYANDRYVRAETGLASYDGEVSFIEIE